MPYEIPQNLKYKEKIAFNLTFEQMAWLGVFGTIAAIIYLKTGLPFPIKEGIALLIASIGCGFAFLNFTEHLKTFRTYKKSINKAGYFDPKMRQLVDVKKIEKDVIFLKDGSMRALLQITPLNFSMLSKNEQQAIIKAYKDFLNSMDFTVQIVARTVNLSLESYLRTLHEKAVQSKNEKLVEQFESFREFLNQFIEQNAVKDRLFYLVIPNSQENGIFLFKSQQKTEQSLKELDIRVKLCQQKLKKCNLLTKHLNSEELTSLMASFFHGFIEAQNEYFFPTTMLKKFEKQNPIRKWIDLNGSEQTIQNAGVTA